MYLGFDEFSPGYLVFVPCVRKIFTSVEVIFDETFHTRLVFKYQTYREALLTWPHGQ